MKKLVLFALCLCLVSVTQAQQKNLKVRAKHVLVIGFDGWGGYSVPKAHDIPNISRLM